MQSASIKNPRLVLIHPPAISKRYLKTKFMPYGMAVLYAFLKKHSVPVIQHDFLMEYLFESNEDIDYHDPRRTFSEEDFFSVLNGIGFHGGLEAFAQKYSSRIAEGEIYAFSIIAYHQFWAALLLGARLKKRRPESLIVFGGPFITIKPVDTFIQYGIADYWVKGNGEIPLLSICRLHSGEDIDKRQIPGLIYRDQGGIVVNNRIFFPAEKELAPDFENLSLNQYKYKHHLTGDNTLFIPYRISKGCPSMCSFCTGRLVDRYDFKSVDKVISEILQLSSKYGTNMFQFADASINGNPRLLSELCEELTRKFPEIRWYSYARIKGFTRELLKKVKAAGCFSLFWGVESAHQPTVDMLGKRFKVEDIYSLLDFASEIGIKNYVHLMYNAPHESWADIESFEKLIQRYIKSEMIVFLPQRFLLEPQSLMFEKPEKYGLKNIQKSDKGLFEREQYTFEESNGLVYEEIEARSLKYRERLDDTLELVKYRNLLDGYGRQVLKWGPKLLALSAKCSRKWGMAKRIHDWICDHIEARNSVIREQL